MQLDAVIRRFLLIFTLLALPFVVGSSCFVLYSSGGGSNNDDDRKDDDEDEEQLIVKSGSFSAPATEGLNYQSGKLKGITGERGEFQYENGDTVQFSIGDIKLGTAVMARPIITPQDLVVQDSHAETAGANLARLLLSLDSETSDDTVTIPEMARAKAVRSNTSVSTAIDFMNFSNEDSFVNAATQLLATLTYDYPFTATLLDAKDIRPRQINSADDGSDQ
jgi:hypothetical protein